MSNLFQNLLTASFHGSIVILVVMALRLVLKKTPKKFLCFLWLLAGIRLLMPFQIQSDLSLQPDYEPVSQVQWQQLEDYGRILPESSQPAQNQETPPVAEPAQPEAPALPAVPSPADAAVVDTPAPKVEVTVEKQLSWFRILPWVWLAVAACFLIYTLWSYIHLKLKVLDAIKIPGGWESEHIETAFILGFIRPKIYIPMGMSRTVRRHILAHERTHLEKGDHWIKMIGFIALALHWFNPLVWAAYILLCKDIEMACDERVVQFMDLQERKSYSAALLSCSTNKAHFAACPVAFGEVSVKYRIKSVLNYKKPSFWISLLGVIAIGFVAVCLVTSPTEDPADPAAPIVQASDDQQQATVRRIEEAFRTVLEQDTYNIFIHEFTDDGGVGWQANYYKVGSNIFWRSSDHINEEGYLLLDGENYVWTRISENEYRWAPTDKYESQLDDLLALYDLSGMVLTDVQSEVKTNDWGETYEELSLFAQRKTDSGELISQKMVFTFDTGSDGFRAEAYDVDWVGSENMACGMGYVEPDAVKEALQQNIELIDPDLVAAEPTQDEQKMREWGIQYRVDDDLLTQYGSEVWFCQADGYNMTVHTDNEYWLEKKTDSGWEKLEMIAQPNWVDASYTLGHGMYTMTFVDWSELYGPLPGGTYRMGKTFELMKAGGSTCTGYAEFEIFHNEATTADQTAALERCYAELDELTKRDHLHWKSVMGSDTYEYWVNGEDYLRVSHFAGSDMPYEEWDDYQKSLFPRTDTSVRYKGIGYGDAREDPDRPSSKVLGMQLATLSPDRGGWTWTSIADDFNYGFFTRSNHNITFPADVGVISDQMVRFVVSWSLGDGLDYVVHITYKFDENGDLCYMEYKPIEEDRDDVYYIEIYDTSAAEIDAKIKPYTENLVVAPFSWEEAKAKYTDEDFNIREDSFVNNGGSPISGPVEAAQLALKEYPNLGEYLSVDVFRDDTTGMWKVTIESYVEYQSTYGYRDIYLSDSGATQLLVYEGPIGYDESRK